MCGLAGFYRRSDDDPRQWEGMLRGVWSKLASRGRDACGYAVYDDATSVVTWWKAPGPSFTWAGQLALTKQTRFVMLHCRSATRGTANLAVNNHPVKSGDIILTHNGVVTNDDEVFTTLGKKRDGEVDSEAIAAMLAAHTPQAMLDGVDGWYALAWTDLRAAGGLSLLRDDTTPLNVARLPNGDMVYASTKELLPVVATHARELAPFSRYQFMPDGTKRHPLRTPAVKAVKTYSNLPMLAAPWMVCVCGHVSGTHTQLSIRRWCNFLGCKCNEFVRGKYTPKYTPLPAVKPASPSISRLLADFQVDARPDGMTRREARLLRGLLDRYLKLTVGDSVGKYNTLPDADYPYNDYGW